jgi:hypothetical protein
MDTNRSWSTTGATLTCTNPDCACELQILTPCPHGDTYTCACGHPFEAVPATNGGG